MPMLAHVLDVYSPRSTQAEAHTRTKGGSSFRFREAFVARERTGDRRKRWRGRRISNKYNMKVQGGRAEVDRFVSGESGVQRERESEREENWISRVERREERTEARGICEIPERLYRVTVRPRSY